MNLKQLLFLFFLGFITSCDNNAEIREVEESRKKYVLAYVDLSKSSSNSSIAEIQNHLLELYESLPPRSLIDVRALNFPGGAKKIAQLEKEFSVPEEAIPSRERQHKDKKEQIKKLFYEKIVNGTERIYSEDDGKSNSCILNTFSPAHDILAGKFEKYDRLELYYFSDMVEDCSSSISSDKIRIVDTRSVSNAEKIVEGWEDIPNFENLNCNIQVVYTNNSKVISDLDYGELRKFWVDLFDKMGFNSQHIYYSEEL